MKIVRWERQGDEYELHVEVPGRDLRGLGLELAVVEDENGEQLVLSDRAVFRFDGRPTASDPKTGEDLFERDGEVVEEGALGEGDAATEVLLGDEEWEAEQRDQARRRLKALLERAQPRETQPVVGEGETL